MKIASLCIAASLAAAGTVSFAESHAMTSTGKPDADFLLMMIPHHQSAIEMAKVELEIGNDEQTKEMAQSMIDDQEAEIEKMRAMLKEMGIDTKSQ